MKKILSLFKRSYEGNRKVYNEISEGAEWVIAGEGTATRKYDGMAILIEKGIVYIRYDAKTGRTPPPDFIPAQPEPDPVTGHWPGWVLPTKGQDKFIKEAIAALSDYPEDGTYEVCGPKIGTRHGPNPENLTEHVLYRHGAHWLMHGPRDYEGIMEYLKDSDIEGIVWHHPDGRMVKIKKNDFPYSK